jgi:hypothetical protein
VLLSPSGSIRFLFFFAEFCFDLVADLLALDGCDVDSGGDFSLILSLSLSSSNCGGFGGVPFFDEDTMEKRQEIYSLMVNH